MLIVDDDEDDRFLFREALREVAPDIACLEAKNGKEAIELLSDPGIRLPSVVFLDVNMPVMNGWECMEKLRADKHLSRIPVVVYSTSSMPHDISRAISMGALCFCVKFDDYEKLKELLRVITNSQEKDIAKKLKNNPAGERCHFKLV